MARVTNHQSRSVGNLGDILKHAALLELASTLASSSSSVGYVDTHTFLLHAPIADLERWRREAESRSSAHPAYAKYLSAERDSLARTSRYRCSSGLVLDALGDRCAAATLGEANGVTRAELREQLREAPRASSIVADDAVAALRGASAWIERAGALLVHVDPFALSADLWATLSPGLDALTTRANGAVIVLYRYTRGAPSAWPRAPVGTIGPVVETRGGPHELAAYASPSQADMVRGVCSTLGWRSGSS